MEKKLVINAFAYCRYSSENQREESISAQKRAIKEYAEENNIIIKKWYIDRAKSGRTDDRDEFINMIKDSSKKENSNVLAVIVHKLDRFSRDQYDMEYYRRELRNNGKSLLSTAEKFENNAKGNLFQRIVGAFNQFYSENLGEEVLKGLKENAYEGKSTGSKAPLGLKVNPITKYFEIDEDNAEAIRIIFDRFVNKGWSYKKIAMELNELGFKTSRGNLFSEKTSILDLLKNEKYKGTMVYMKSKTDGVTKKRIRNNRYYDKEKVIIVENVIPPIVSKEIFDKAQEIIEHRRKHVGTQCKHRTNLLSGKVICGECNCPMVINTRKGGNGNIYSTYRCSGKSSKADVKCHNREISVNHLERFVLLTLKHMLKDPEIIKKIGENYKNFDKEKCNEDKKSVKRYQGKIKKLESDIKFVSEQLIQNKENPELYKVFIEQLSSLSTEKTKMENELNSLECEIPKLTEYSSVEIKRSVDSALEYIEDNDIEKLRVIIDKFVQQIVVTKNEIEVVFYITSISLYIPLGKACETRDRIRKYKGILPELLENKISLRRIRNINTDNPTIFKILSL